MATSSGKAAKNVKPPKPTSSAKAAKAPKAAPSKRLTVAAENKKARAAAAKKNPGVVAAKAKARAASAPKKAQPLKKAAAPRKAQPLKKAAAPRKAQPLKKATAPRKAQPLEKATAARKQAPGDKPAPPAGSAAAPTPGAPADCASLFPDTAAGNAGLEVAMAAVFASIFSENVAGSSPGRKTRPEPERAGEPDEEGFKPILENSAGIDIGASEHYVAVPNAGRGPKVKSFRAETYDLRNMAAFLEESGAKTVVMEATGVYWYAPFAFLKKMGFDVRLLNPRYVTNVLGKTDVRDCQWLKKLASCGLAPECFVPPRQFFELRAMVRLRIGLVRQQSAAVNRIIKCLRMANINLEHAVADVKGKTGLRIIDAIIAGEKEPLALAGMRDKRCRKKKEEEIARCLDGVYSAYTVIELKCHRSILGTIQEQIEELDENILVHLEAFKPGPSGPGGGDSAPCAPRARKPADKAIDLAGPEIVRILGNGVDLTAIPGISSRISLAIVSEIGTDISKWRSAKHFSSWLGLCPGSKISGGKVISATTRKVNSPAAQALMMAAKAVGRSDNAFGEFYRKKKCSRGPQKALTATAHLIARTVYGMIRHGSAYTAKIAEERERRAAARKDARLSREIAARGDGWFAAEAARRGYAPVPEAA